MDRAALDEFFAKADDVLTDWDGSTDAMIATAPTDEDVAALPGDSYYAQRWLHLDPASEVHAVAAAFGEAHVIIRPSMEAFQRAMLTVIDQLAELARVIQPIVFDPADVDQIAIGVDGLNADHFILDETHAFRVDDPRTRALQARRSRSTGPADPYRLDGRRRRRR